jgi:hypothetical protein
VIREGRAETPGKLRGNRYTRINSGERKLAIATTDQQRGFGAANKNQ